VTHLGRDDGVGKDEDVWHGRRHPTVSVSVP
jgi:hypothetical protein